MSLKAWMMIGPPGAGKTTRAQKLAKKHNAHIISGDEIKKALCGASDCMIDWNDLEDEIVARLEQVVGDPVIIDGTFCDLSSRQSITELLLQFGYQVSAVVVQTPLETCIIRNALRTRYVPRWIITQMYENLQRSSRFLDKEQFKEIIYLN